MHELGLGGETQGLHQSREGGNGRGTTLLPRMVQPGLVQEGAPLVLVGTLTCDPELDGLE